MFLLLLSVVLITSSPSTGQQYPLSFGQIGDPVHGWFDNRIALNATHYFEGANKLASGTQIRQARFGVHVLFYEDVVVDLDIGFKGDEVDINDAWVSFRLKHAWLKIGSFKEPFGLERLTSSRYLVFAERAMASQTLTPGRKIGLQLARSGAHWYAALGLFGQEADQEATKVDEALALTGRLVYRPVDTDMQRLHLGLALTRRTPDATGTKATKVRFRSLPETRVSNLYFLNTNWITQVDYTESLGLEGALASGPVFFQGEYLYTAVRRSSGRPDLAMSGGYVLATWVLTGEHLSYLPREGEFGPVVSAHPGSTWELALRYSILDLNDPDNGASTLDLNDPNNGASTLNLNDPNDGARGGAAKNLSLGLNWCINPNIRATFNLVFVDNDEFADGSSPSGSLIGNNRYSFIQAKLYAFF